MGLFPTSSISLILPAGLSSEGAFAKGLPDGTIENVRCFLFRFPAEGASAKRLCRLGALLAMRLFLSESGRRDAP